MKKSTLIKFFDGEASEDEVNDIINWVNFSSENRKYFAKEKAVYEAIAHSTLTNKMTDNSHTYCPPKNYLKKRKIHFYEYCLYAASIAVIFFIITSIFDITLSVKVGKRFSTSDPDKTILDHQLSISENYPPLIHTLYTEKGVKGFIMLPDSSKVWLNSDSKIYYPNGFKGKYRTVKISGEAFFEVKKDTLHPMIVLTNKKFSIEVLGTTFNLRSYDNDDNAVTTLYTGSIKMHYIDKRTSRLTTINLKPSESFIYLPKLSSPRQFTYLKPENQSAWKNGELIFDNTPMSDVIKMLERWHGTKFIIKNNEVYQYKLSAEFSSESIVQIMEIMKLIMPIKYSCDNNVVTLE